MKMEERKEEWKNGRMEDRRVVNKDGWKQGRKVEKDTKPK